MGLRVRREPIERENDHSIAFVMFVPIGFDMAGEPFGLLPLEKGLGILIKRNNGLFGLGVGHVLFKEIIHIQNLFLGGQPTTVAATEEIFVVDDLEPTAFPTRSLVRAGIEGGESCMATSDNFAWDRRGCWFGLNRKCGFDFAFGGWFGGWRQGVRSLRFAYVGDIDLSQGLVDEIAGLMNMEADDVVVLGGDANLAQFVKRMCG